MKLPITLESLHSPKLYLYTIYENNYEAELKKVHNCIAIYINPALEDVQKGEITQRAALIEGENNYDGLKHLMLNIINKIGYILKCRKETSLRVKQMNIYDLRDLVHELDKTDRIPCGLIDDLNNILDSAEEKIYPITPSEMQKNVINLRRTAQGSNLQRAFY